MPRFGERTRPTSLVSTWDDNSNGAKPWWATYGQVQRGLQTGVNVTCDTTAHTKGAWVEAVASTSGNADLIIIGALVQTNATDTASLFDIGFGAAGSEVVAVANVACGSWNYLTTAIPIAIPSGTRIAIRAQSIVSAGKVIPFYLQVYDSGGYNNAPLTVDVLGTSTSTSRGTALSSTANAYAQVVASTTQQYRAVVIIPSASDSTLAGFNETYTLATGAAGSEVDRGSMTVNTTANEIVQFVGLVSYGIISGPFLTGTRLAVKGNSTITGSNFDVTLIGIP